MAPKNPRGKDAGEADPQTDCVDELPVPIVPDEPVPQPKSPQHEAVSALFKNEANLRQAITENLKPLRAESLAVDNRVQQAFKNFNPAPLSPEERARGRYVEPGADPSEVLKSVIMSGADALRSSNNSRAITLRKTTELRRLIREALEPTDSLEGVVDLDPLIKHIYGMSTGSSLTTEPVFKRCKADLEAETILRVAEKPKNANGGSVANLEESSSGSGTRDAQQLVDESVNLQMKSATAPESRLEYAYIPNSAEKDKDQNAILQTFQLRPGASDVTSYHDFHTLQIAFPHVWTRIFDGELESLGRELYWKYVELKKFTGSTDPDLTISTFADLKRLIEQVKTLTNFTEGAMPLNGRGSGDASTPIKSPEDWTKELKNLVPPDPVSRLTAAFIELIITEAANLGKKERLDWYQFGRQLPRPEDKIIYEVKKDVAGVGKVEIALHRRENQRWRGIEFQQFDASVGPKPVFRAMISNNSKDPLLQYPGGPLNNGGAIVLNTSQVTSGLIEFDSQEGAPSETKLGRYLLFNLEDVLKDGTRVTFDWIEG